MTWLLHSVLSVFNIYRPSLSSRSSKPLSVFLDYSITGDFNIHLDNPTDYYTSQFPNLWRAPKLFFPLSISLNTYFPTHNKNHILDLLWLFPCTISLYDLLHTIRSLPCFHYTLSVGRTPLPLPTFLSFCRHHSIDIDSFISDSQSSRLITNPPTSLGSLLISYNTTLSSLLDKHAPIIFNYLNAEPNPIHGLHPLFMLSGPKSVMLKLSTNTLILISLGYHSSLLETATTT